MIPYGGHVYYQQPLQSPMLAYGGAAVYHQPNNLPANMPCMPVAAKNQDDFMAGTEKAVRKDYDPVAKRWKRSAVVLKIDPVAFAQGSLRRAYKMRDLTLGETDNEFVAKMSINPQENRQTYFDDVAMQMEAKMWAERFNSKTGLHVDFLVAYVAELVERTGRPLIGVEKLVMGNYVKYNNNWDWNDDRRNTPQAFSHFTWEESGKSILVCDLQGVGDLWTDPQIHSRDGKGYGKGNMGMRGIAAFLNNHRCNAICMALKLPMVGKAPKQNNDGTVMPPMKAGMQSGLTNTQFKAKMVQAELKKPKEEGARTDHDRIAIIVLGAGGLNVSETSPDCSVTILCGHRVCETKVIYDNREPVWNEKFQLDLPADGSVNTLEAVLFIREEEDPTMVGFARIEFDKLEDQAGFDERQWPLRAAGGAQVGWLKLKILRFRSKKPAASAPDAALGPPPPPPLPLAGPNKEEGPGNVRDLLQEAQGIKVMVKQGRGFRELEGLPVQVLVRLNQCQAATKAQPGAQLMHWNQKIAFPPGPADEAVRLWVIPDVASPHVRFQGHIPMRSINFDASGHAGNVVVPMKQHQPVAGEGEAVG